MKATTLTQLNKLLNSIVDLHNASEDYKAELEKLKPLYDKATPDEQVEIRNAVAQLIGKLYKVKPKLLKTGALGFDRDTAVSKAFRRTLPVDTLSTKKKAKTTRKSTDPVAQLVAKYEAMSKIERRRFLTQIGQ